MQKAIKPLLLLVLLFAICLIALWPGIMSPDAGSQYVAAMSGIYSDHHPPLMSWLWRQFNKVYDGTGIVYTLHLILLYTACGIFIYIFRESKLKWWYVVYPLIPSIFAYTIFIVKDASFVFSYLLAGSIISLILTNRSIRFKRLLLVLCALLLLYGTAVKFQAKYLLLFFTIAVAYCSSYKLDYKTILRGLIIYLLTMLIIWCINIKLVPNSQKSYSWQLVKLYDLSSISLILDKPLYPEFILQDPSFDFTKVKQLYDPQKVDDLTFAPNPVLRSGANATEREQLLKYWQKTVIDNPGLYLKIRLRLWSHNLTSVPSEYNDPANFLKRTALKPIVDIPGIDNLINHTYRLSMNLFMFLWIFPLQILYCVLSIRYFKQSLWAPPLALFAFSSFAMLVALLFFSMAGVARYVLFCTCAIHASLGFAYFTWHQHSTKNS